MKLEYKDYDKKLKTNAKSSNGNTPAKNTFADRIKPINIVNRSSLMNNSIKDFALLTSSQEVEEICKPLFDAFNINSFIYTKVYKNQSYFTLSNRADWVAHFFSKRYLHPTVDFSLLESGHFINLQELGIPEEQIITARESFNADFWYNIIKRHDSYYEIIGLASERGNVKIIDLYLRNKEVLEHFYYYFKDKAQNLIKNAEKNKILRPNRKFDNKNVQSESDQIREFLEKTTIDRYYILEDSQNGYVTKREYEILALLSKGSSIKELSHSLNVTPRTAKSYLYNAMRRLGCYSRSDILNLIQLKNVF